MSGTERPRALSLAVTREAGQRQRSELAMTSGSPVCPGHLKASISQLWRGLDTPSTAPPWERSLALESPTVRPLRDHGTPPAAAWDRHRSHLGASEALHFPTPQGGPGATGKLCHRGRSGQLRREGLGLFFSGWFSIFVRKDHWKECLFRIPH